MDEITLTGIQAMGRHGVFPDERRNGQRFAADVTMHVDTREAAAGDDLNATVDYGTVATGVVGILAGEPADLIETVAERIAAYVLSDERVQAVEVTVHKPEAPVKVPFGDIAVTVRRDRRRPPSVAAPGAAEPVVEDTIPVLADDTTDDASAAAPSSPVVALPAVIPPVIPVAAPIPAVPAAAPVVAAAPMPAAAPMAPVVTSPFAAPPFAEPPMAPAVARYADEPAEAEPAPVHPLDKAPDHPVAVVLAIGANLGAAQETLRRAVSAIAATPGMRVNAVSALARTAAVGGPADQPDYLNAIVLATTTLSPRELLANTQRIELENGRERIVPWGPRTLDIDIITIDGVLVVADDLELPHPRAAERAFVLAPWAQVDPDALLPGLGGGPVAALAATAPDRAGIRWLALDWLTEAVPGPDVPSPAIAVAPQPIPTVQPSADQPPAVPQTVTPTPAVTPQPTAFPPLPVPPQPAPIQQGAPAEQQGSFPPPADPEQWQPPRPGAPSPWGTSD